MPLFFVVAVMMSPLNYLFLDLAGVTNVSYEKLKQLEDPGSDPSSTTPKVRQSRGVQTRWEVFGVRGAFRPEEELCTCAIRCDYPGDEEAE